MAPGALGCVFTTDDACIAAVERLVQLGVAVNDVHIGAVAAERAQEIARRTGAQADIAPEDPLHGVHGYAGRATARRAVDRAGVVGAGLGALFGFFFGRPPLGHIIPVSPVLEPLADALFFFVVGLFVGSILGAALAPQQSSHAAFRLVDGMHEGSLGLIVAVPAGRGDEITRVLESLGGTGMTQL